MRFTKSALFVLLSAAPCWAQSNLPLLGVGSHVSGGGGVGTFTLASTSPTTVGCSGSTTCSITLASSIPAGDLATIDCYLTNPAVISSVSAGGTAIPVYTSSLVGNISTLFPARGYIYPTSSTAGPIVVTFNNSMGTGSTCVLRAYSVSSGTPKLDWASASLKAGTTSVTGQTPIFSGSNDVVVQSNNTDYQITTAVSGYVDGKFDATNGPGWADKLNSVSTTPPTWTIASGSGNASSGGMAFATDATACNDQALVNFEGGTNGTNLSTTNLASSTFGGIGAWGAAQGTGTNTEQFNTSAQNALVSAFSSCDGHQTGSGSLGMKFDVSTSTGYYFPLAWTPFAPKVSIGFWYNTSIPIADTGFYSMNRLTGNSGGDFTSVMLTTGQIYLETFGNPNGNPDTGTKFSYAANTWYWITVQYCAFGTTTCAGGTSEHSMNIYGATGTLVNAETKAASNTGSPNPAEFHLGRVGDSGTPANFIYFDNVKIDYSGSFPILP